MGLAPVTSRFQALHPNSLPLGHAASFTSSWGGHKVHIEMDQFLFTFQWKTYHLTTINKNFNREKKTFQNESHSIQKYILSLVSSRAGHFILTVFVILTSDRKKCIKNYTIFAGTERFV